MPGVDAEAERDVGSSLRALGLDPLLHLQRALHRLARLVGDLDRRAPDDHDVVTVVLVHAAFIAVDDGHHTVEVTVEVPEEDGWRHSLGDRREPPDVAEEPGHAAVLAAQGELAGPLPAHARA